MPAPYESKNLRRARFFNYLRKDFVRKPAPKPNKEFAAANATATPPAPPVKPHSFTRPPFVPTGRLPPQSGHAEIRGF